MSKQPCEIKRWCFTINNYSQAEKDGVLHFLSSEDIRYGIVGDEVGANGTPHLQGFFSLRSKRLRLTAIKKISGFERAHLEPAKGNDESNRKYCSKDGSFTEYGKPFGGKRMEGGDGGYTGAMADISEGATWEDFKSAYPDLSFKHMGNIRTIIREARTIRRPVPERPRVWQRECMDHIALQGDRKICIYVDEIGGAGKSVLARKLGGSFRTFYSTGGKVSDLMCAFQKDDWDYAIFDMARCTNVEYWPYGFTEMLKNGAYTSLKYDSMFWEFNPPKCVWFTNEMPDRAKWSSDRYCIHILNHNGPDMQIDPRGWSGEEIEEEEEPVQFDLTFCSCDPHGAQDMLCLAHL